jgi:hypothetical protein
VTETATSTETATATLEPTAEITEIVLPTAEITAEITAEQTESLQPLQPEITNTATQSTPLLPEPALAPILSEAFHTDDISRWNIGSGWELVPQEQGFALQVTNSDAAVTSNSGVYDDVAVEMLVQSATGTLHLHLRDAYTLNIYPTGQVDLYRGTALLATTTTTMSNTWRHVRFSAMGDTLRVAIDNVEIIALRDTAPILTAGQIAFNATFPQSSDNSELLNTLLVDNIRFWIPEVELPTATNTAIVMPSATNALTITPIPPLEITNTVISLAAIESIITVQPAATGEPTETAVPSATTELIATASPFTVVEQSLADSGEIIIQQEAGDEWCVEFDFTLTSGTPHVSARKVGSTTRGQHTASGWIPCTGCFGQDSVHLNIKFLQSTESVTAVEFELSAPLTGLEHSAGLWQWNGIGLDTAQGLSGGLTYTFPQNATIAAFPSVNYANVAGININYDDTEGQGSQLTTAIQRLRIEGTGQSPLPSTYDCLETPPQFNVIVVDAPTGGELQAMQSVEGVGTFGFGEGEDENDGHCTIREAIEKTNVLSDSDPSNDDDNTDCEPEALGNCSNGFCIGLLPFTYRYGVPLPTIMGNVELSCSQLCGSGEFTTIERSDTASQFRVFEIADGGSLTLKNIVVRNGYAVPNLSATPPDFGHGGGILNAGNLTLINSAVIDNYASVNGGGIYNTGIASIINSCIVGNISTFDGNSDGIPDGSSVFTTNTFNAQGNWWGAADGPSTFGSSISGSGDFVSGVGNFSDALSQRPPACSPPPPSCDNNNFATIIEPPTQQFRSQETQDMLSIAQMGNEARLIEGSGLILHDGPTINARRLAVLSWGLTVQIDAYIEFPQAAPTNPQLWYRVIEFSKGGAVYRYNGTLWLPIRGEPDSELFVLLNAAKDVWVNARMDSFNYVEGVDSITNPCSNQQSILNLNAPENASQTITFTYDRETVARYAFEHSYANNVNSPPPTRVTVNRNIPNVPFAEFVYSDLASGTGSAVFVSEAIWAGGLPLTLGLTESCNGTPGPHTLPGFGWRFCWNVGSASTSPSWDFHQYLTGYFTNDIAPQPSNTVATFMNDILDTDEQGKQLRFTGTRFQNALAAQDVSLYLILSDGVINEGADTALGDFARNHLKDLRRGDYMWIDSVTGSTGDYHGLMVVGWFEPRDCPEVMVNITPLPFSSFSSEIPANGNYVPYVADFTGTQQPVPRPFYCTRYRQETLRPEFEGFVPHNWYFYQFLSRDASGNSSIDLAPNEIFVNPNWNW